MKVVATGFFLVWIFLLQQVLCIDNFAEILYGQCYAFCLTRLDTRLKNNSDVFAETISIPVNSAIHICRKEQNCKWCLYACDRPEENYNNLEECQGDCQNPRIRSKPQAQQACNDSCEFISRSSHTKFGNCPDPLAMKEFGAACLEECTHDLDCESVNKCCHNGCGQVCHRPVNYDVFPPIPTHLKFKERKDGGMFVEWEGAGEDPIIKPVLYVMRWWCSQNVRKSITTRPKVKLKGQGHPYGVKPGDKCSFKVAAINIRGSQGFSTTQQYTKNFLKPSKPLNLERTRTRLRGSKLDVTIRWQPPLYTDGLPVTKYLVYWSDTLPNAAPEYIKLYFNQAAVKGSTSYTVTGLDPGTSIFVQVRAVVRWRNKNVKGDAISTYINAVSSPQPAVQDEDLYGSSARSFIYNLTVETPRFYQKELCAMVSWNLFQGSHITKFMVYWREQTCEGEARHRKTRNRSGMEATSVTWFNLANLKSDCLYKVEVHGVSVSGVKGEGQVKVFSTPLCEDTEGLGPDVVCQPTESPPPPPSALQVYFRHNSNCMCQAVLSWERPHHDVQVSQFAVLWGPSRAPWGEGHGAGGLSAGTIVYHQHPYSLTVQGNEACMTYLEKSRHYTAQVVAQADKLRSDPVLLHFTTPAHMAPCYELPSQNTGGYWEQPENSVKFVGSVELPDANVTMSVPVVRDRSFSPPQVYSLTVVLLSIVISISNLSSYC